MPKDRNLIDQFYSVGFGGNGGLFGRVNDNRGVGWAGTYFSADFRQDAADLGVELSFVNFRMALRVRAVPRLWVRFCSPSTPRGRAEHADPSTTRLP